MGSVPRRFGALIGLAAICVLAGGFLVVTLNRAPGTGSGGAPSASAPSSRATTTATPASTTSPAPGPTGAGTSGQWRSVTVQANLSLGPRLAVSGSRLFMFGIDANRITRVWSSSDAMTWQQVASPGIAMDFVPRDAVGDGNGGLLIAGELTSSESAVPQIWRSADGRSFVQAEVESFMSGTAGIAATASGSGEIVAVAASAGKFVAFGDHHVVDTNKTSGEALGLDVWHSANGSTWSHVALPGSDGYQAASMTAWKGGFAAVGNSDTGDDVPAVWLSPDGVSWHKSGDVPAFGAVSVVALGDRVVCLGAKRDSTLGMVPASWSSTDGKTWREGVAPVDGGYGSIFDLAAVQGSTLYGIGMSHIAWAGTGSDPSASPNASPSLAFKVVPSTIWASTDGTTWSRVGPAPDYSQYTSSLIVFDGHLVLAIQGLDGVVVSTGNLP